MRGIVSVCGEREGEGTDLEDLGEGGHDLGVLVRPDLDRVAVVPSAISARLCAKGETTLTSTRPRSQASGRRPPR